MREAEYGPDEHCTGGGHEDEGRERGREEGEVEERRK